MRAFTFATVIHNANSCFPLIENVLNVLNSLNLARKSSKIDFPEIVMALKIANGIFHVAEKPTVN